ncbi:MAG TPA: hypothetical protein PKL13_00935 [bacterium]|nr:hypothetical protein [bacterium]
MNKEESFLQALEDMRIFIQRKIKKSVYFKEKRWKDKYSGFSSLNYLFFIEESALLWRLIPIKKKKLLCEICTWTRKISIRDNALAETKEELEKKLEKHLQF